MTYSIVARDPATGELGVARTGAGDLADRLTAVLRAAEAGLAGFSPLCVP